MREQGQTYGTAPRLEIDKDDSMSSDGEFDQEPQQGHICVSADPRRVGESGGEPVISVCVFYCGELRQAWRMAKENAGSVPRPKENAPSNYALIPFELLDPRVHIEHTCEALSEIQTMAHHRCWRLIHGELSRLASPKCRFICIN